MMDDLISREMAIGVVGRRCGACIQGILDIPSAEPEKRTEERTETHACDCISRQSAIEAFLTELTKRERKNLLHTWSTVEVKYFITKMLEQMPSAQPEIIRCKDCRYTDEYGVCQSSKGLAIQDDDDFCSHAERRGG